MFEALRRMILPFVIVVLFFFVALIVLQWGADISGRGKYSTSNAAGTINGEEVSWESFQSIYNNLYQQEIQKSGGDIPDNKSAELEQSAWNQIVADRLLSQEAAKHNIKITDDDIYLYLRLQPPNYLLSRQEFQTDGQFDYQKYLGAMADPQWAPFWASVETLAYQDLLKAKVQQLVVEAANVSEEEVKNAFLSNLESVKVRLINVSKGTYSKPAPPVNEEDIVAFYNENIDRYELGERVVLDIASARKAATEKDWELTRMRASELRDSVLAGSDFAEMAEIYSDDIVSAQNGGDLGWFESGRMVATFDSAVFAMKKGDVSPPIRTQFGWHIIKNKGFRDTTKIVSGEKKKVREVSASHILVKIQPGEGTLDSLYSEAQEFQFVASQEGWDEAESKTSLQVASTPPIQQGGAIAGIGQAPNAIAFAFANEEGTFSGVMENSNYYFVVRVSKKVPKGPQSLEEVRRRVEQDVTSRMLSEICNDTAQVIYSEIENGKKFEEAASAHKATVETLASFTRRGVAKIIGRDPRAIGAAFSLKEPGQYTKPIPYANGSVIIELIERNTPDLESFNQKRDSVYSALVLGKKQQMFGNWYTQLLEDSEIENYVEQQRQASAQAY